MNDRRMTRSLGSTSTVESIEADLAFCCKTNGESNMERSVSPALTPHTPIFKPRKRGRPSKKLKLDEDNGPSTSNMTSSRPIVKQRRKGDTKLKLQGGRPAELYRTDLITAMKISDDAMMLSEDCMIMEDSWRHEWNNGVQVPVAHENVTKTIINTLYKDNNSKTDNEQTTFKMPKKLLRQSKDQGFDPTIHCLVHSAKKSACVCRYDLDATDVRWLELLNAKRLSLGINTITEIQLEKIIECLETLCADNLQATLLDPSSVNLGREYDEHAVCDICLSPFADDDDEIVFCDGCDLCVHQSCYGIANLPDGPWLCRPCALQPGYPPHCILCPNTGGAFKCTRSGERWAHVSCVLWVPETSFAEPDKAEPVIGISQVPEERWCLRCVLCDKREGACIQCSHKTCRVAYHVTCAQRHGMNMAYRATKARGSQGVDLVSFCPKHSRCTTTEAKLPSPSRFNDSIFHCGSPRSPSPETLHSFEMVPRLPESPSKRKAKRLTALQKGFFTYVSMEECAKKLDFSEDCVSAAYEYWKMKRRKNHNKPLLASREEEEHLMERQEEEILVRRVRMLVALRQNLEKARNLCYMLERREKMKKQYVGSVESLMFRLHDVVCNYSLSKRESSLLAGYLEPTNVYDDLMAVPSNEQNSFDSTSSISDESMDIEKYVFMEFPDEMNEKPNVWNSESVPGHVISPKAVHENRDRNFNISPVEQVASKAVEGTLPSDATRIKSSRVNGVHSVCSEPRSCRPNGSLFANSDETPENVISTKRVSRNGFYPPMRQSHQAIRRVTRSTQ